MDCVHCLLLHSADPNCTTRETEYSALILAAFKGHTKVVRLLLDAGANPLQRNKYMETALDVSKHITTLEPHVKAKLVQMLQRAQNRAGANDASSSGNSSTKAGKESNKRERNSGKGGIIRLGKAKIRKK